VKGCRVAEIFKGNPIFIYSGKEVKLDNVVKNRDRCHCEERSDVAILVFHLFTTAEIHFVRNDNFFDFLREHQNFILLYLLYPKKI